MRILSIQDISCVGQCSLTVALPVISAFGIETSILPSAVLSTHTGGFSGYTFRDLTEDIPKIKEHWQKEKITFDAFYTGYVGNKKQIEYIFEVVEATKKDNSLFIVDPVMADFGKLYDGFDNDFIAEMRKAVAKSDYVLPNVTEACFLSYFEYKDGVFTEKYVEDLICAVKELGADKIVLKGISFDENTIGVAVYDGKKIDYYLHEKINRRMHGTGDVFASCFTGALLSGFSLYDSAKTAADMTLKAIKSTTDINHWYGVNFEKIIPDIVELFR